MSVWCCGWLWEQLRGPVVLWRRSEQSLLSPFDLELTRVTPTSTKSTNSVWEVCRGLQEDLKTTNRIIWGERGDSKTLTHDRVHTATHTNKTTNGPCERLCFLLQPQFHMLGWKAETFFVWNNGLLATIALFTFMSVAVTDFWGSALKASEDHSSVDPHGMRIHTV